MDAGFVPSIKCVLIGDYEVGKTSYNIPITLILDEFDQRLCYTRTLESIFSRAKVTGPVQIHIEHAFRLYLLHIHDTEGAHAPTTPDPSPPLEAINSPPIDLSEASINADENSNESSKSQSTKWISRRVEYGLADVVLICFSLANRASFEDVTTVWRQEIQQFCPHVPFIILGCKLDLRRPDPTTPASIPKRSHPPPAILQLRRPKPARSSTGGSTTGSTGPGSPSTSDFGHPVPDSSTSHSSMTRPVSILTNSSPAVTRSTNEPSPGPSSAPPSDVENLGRKLKPKSSFPIPFPAKVFRRKSVTDASIISTGTQSTLLRLDTRPADASASMKSGGPAGVSTSGPAQPTTPKSPRYAAIPPFIRSFSHANVFRRVLSRSRSGTLDTDATSNPSSSTNPFPMATRDPSRPALSHRLTSGSADDPPVRTLHSHIRTSSQPSPTIVDRPPQAGGRLAGEVAVTGGSVEVAGGSLTVGTEGGTEGGAGSATSSNPRPSPGRKVTRIEEPPMSMRHRTTSYQEARETARRLGASGYMECSSLTLVNVVKVFDEAVRIAVERRLASASSLHGRRGKKNEECVVV